MKYLNKVFMRHSGIYPVALLITVALFLSACSIKKMVVRQATDFFGESRKVFEQETDLELAETSIGSNLKLLEAMQVHDPENESLNLLIAEIYSVYTLSFVEDKVDAAEALHNDKEAARERVRAKMFYLRARDAAGRVLLPKLEIDNLSFLT
ncbi:MAG TPA: TRAP transporter TatT component family protein, partial [Turneriella sp.]|nr:TRAP transporter TatT component family protein [Turneriella sp.]